MPIQNFDKMTNTQETTIGVKTILQSRVSVESSVSISTTTFETDFHESMFASLVGIRVLWTTSRRFTIGNVTALATFSPIDSELAAFRKEPEARYGHYNGPFTACMARTIPR